MGGVKKTLASAGIGASNIVSWYAPRMEGTANVLDINLNGRVEEVQLYGLWQRFLPSPGVGMRELLSGLDLASRDDGIKALVLTVSDHDLDWGRTEELCMMVRRFRESGKYALAYLEAPSNIDTLLAAACDKVVLPPGMPLHLTGLLSEVLYFKQMLDKLSVEPELFQAGKYKSAIEPFTREGMSQAHREAVEALLDSIYEEWVGALARGRHLQPERVKELIDEGPWIAEEAQEAGLVDEIMYADRIEDYLQKWLGTSPRRISLEKYLKIFGPSATMADPWKSGKGLAILNACGPIHGGESRYMGPGESSVGSDTFRKALDQAREDESIAAAIIRVDSPGGSAVHSDLIWRDVERLAGTKPVVVSMADVAASGGYYIAMPAHHIVASPTTLTGSIGVIGGKINLKGLYTRVGLKKEQVGRGKHANMGTDYGPYSEELRSKVKTEMDAVYKSFVEKAARGRKKEFHELEESAQGRVWTGSQAGERGLVDEMGSLITAIERAKERAGIPPDKRVPTAVLPRIRKLGVPFLPFSVSSFPSLGGAASKMALYESLARSPLLTIMPYYLRIR
ncbi:MAG: signal peptide peptidase SppA [bacterium]